MLKIGFVFTKKKILKTRVDKMRTGNFNYQPSIVNKQFKKTGKLDAEAFEDVNYKKLELEPGRKPPVIQKKW